MIYRRNLVGLGIDSIGANITSFQYDGKHIFFPQQAVKEDGALQQRGGSHICFPNFGTNQKENNHLILPRHGFIRDTAFSNLRKRRQIRLRRLSDRHI